MHDAVATTCTSNMYCTQPSPLALERGRLGKSLAMEKAMVDDASNPPKKVNVRAACPETY